MTALKSMLHMPLANAYLCEDCHAVGNCSEQCPACASQALMALAGVLNRSTCTALVKYRDRWAVDDPVLDCAIFLVDREMFRQLWGQR